MTNESSVKGSGRGMTATTASPVRGGENWTSPYTLACKVKSRPSLTLTLMTKREEKKGKRCLSLSEPGVLATFVGYVPCVSICLY
jgi:hypothetical protein